MDYDLYINSDYTDGYTNDILYFPFVYIVSYSTLFTLLNGYQYILILLSLKKKLFTICCAKRNNGQIQLFCIIIFVFLELVQK